MPTTWPRCVRRSTCQGATAPPSGRPTAARASVCTEAGDDDCDPRRPERMQARGRQPDRLPTSGSYDAAPSRRRRRGAPEIERAAYELVLRRRWRRPYVDRPAVVGIDQRQVPDLGALVQHRDAGTGELQRAPARASWRGRARPAGSATSASVGDGDEGRCPARHCVLVGGIGMQPAGVQLRFACRLLQVRAETVGVDRPRRRRRLEREQLEAGVGPGARARRGRRRPAAGRPLPASRWDPRESSASRARTSSLRLVSCVDVSSRRCGHRRRDASSTAVWNDSIETPVESGRRPPRTARPGGVHR